MSLNKRIKSFGYAFKGLLHLFRTEVHAQIHLVVLLLVAAAGFYFQITKSEWIAILLCIGMVVSLEAMNTAIERLTDLASPDYHPLAGHAKDVAAGAVLWASIISVIVGVLVFWPYVFG
jgi:diacylglycerol kinase (ATP)